MNDPTTKASLESALMGLLQLRHLIHGRSDDEIDNLVDNKEAIGLDGMRHSLLEYAEGQDDG